MSCWKHFLLRHHFSQTSTQRSLCSWEEQHCFTLEAPGLPVMSIFNHRPISQRFRGGCHERLTILKRQHEQWHYTSPTNGITIRFEFLAAGGGFVSASKSPQPTSLGGFIPSLEELAVMKTNAFNNRSEPNDLSDLEFILRKMSDEGKRFENVDEEDKEVLYEVE